MSAVEVEQPISRTYEYRKVMKPMLERKRRARINRCLDELKELMLTALQAEGENVSKLEKADILELTVQHLHKLRKQHRLSCNSSSGTADADRFRAGFTHCATEVSRCLATTPGVDVKLGTKLMTHLGHRLNDMEKFSLPLSIRIGSNGNVNSTNGGTCSPAPSSPSSISSVESSVSSYSIPLTPPSPCSGKASPTTFGAVEVNGSSHVQHPTTMMPLTSSTNYNPNRLLTVISSNANNTTSSTNNTVYTGSVACSQHNVSSVWRPW